MSSHRLTPSLLAVKASLRKFTTAALTPVYEMSRTAAQESAPWGRSSSRFCSRPLVTREVLSIRSSMLSAEALESIDDPRCKRQIDNSAKLACHGSRLAGAAAKFAGQF